MLLAYTCRQHKYILYHPQENIIREFNLNELFQKSKKLNKSHGSKEEEQNGSQPQEGGEELPPDTDNTEQPKESKKDQWRGAASSLCFALNISVTFLIVTAKYF